MTVPGRHIHRKSFTNQSTILLDITEDISLKTEYLYVTEKNINDRQLSEAFKLRQSI